MRVSYLSLAHIMLTAASPHPRRDTSSVYWILAGDSTTAPGGGWGDGFLSTTVAPGSSGANYGHGGATTKSFREGGDWDRVLGDIESHKDTSRVYVTIQFGHNDQKPESGVSLSDYTTNLATFASEVVAAGATPILLSPLTRRTFNGSTVIENLAKETAATIDVAETLSLHWVDVNRASTAYVNAIGQAAADKYNLEPKDRTHLNPWGGVVFARLVSDLLVAKYPEEFKSVTTASESLSQLIAEGKPA